MKKMSSPQLISPIYAFCFEFIKFKKALVKFRKRFSSFTPLQFFIWLALVLLPHLSFAQSGSLCSDYGNIPNGHILIDGPGQSVNLGSISNSTLFQNKYFHVKKDLIITGNNNVFIFINCTFNIEPGVKIEIPNNKSATFSDCRFFSCNQAWKGIEVQGKLSLLISTIESAYIAVFAYPGAQNISMSGNTIRICYFGLKNFRNGSITGSDFGLSKFANNIIDKSNILLPLPGNIVQNSDESLVKNVGIDLENCIKLKQLGQNGICKNYYFGMRFYNCKIKIDKIKVHNSGKYSINAIKTNIEYLGTYPGQGELIGIPQEVFDFYNNLNYAGFFVDQSSLNVKYSSFFSNISGYSFIDFNNSLANESMNIERNYFMNTNSDFLKYIVAQRPASIGITNSNTINYNNFVNQTTFPTSIVYAIQIKEAPSNPLNYLEIRHNSIKFTHYQLNCAILIETINNDRNLIINNTIESLGNLGNGDGIRIIGNAGPKGNEVISNTLIGHGSFFGLKNGINIIGNEKNMIMCMNELVNIRNGIQINTGSISDKFALFNNRFETNNIGLLIGDLNGGYASIDVQKCMDNVWKDESDTKNEAVGINFKIKDDSHFFIRTNNQPPWTSANFRPNNPTSGTGNLWFQDKEDICNFLYPPLVLPENLELRSWNVRDYCIQKQNQAFSGNELPLHFKRLIENPLPEYWQSNGYHWETIKYRYNMIKDEWSNFFTNPFISEFCVNVENSSVIQQLYNAELLERLAWQFPQASIEKWNNFNNSINNLQKFGILIDSLIENETNSSLIDELIIQNQQISSEIRNLHDSVQVVENFWTSIRNYYFNCAINLLSQISTQHQIETDYIIANKTRLNTLINNNYIETLTVSQYEALKDIADNCFSISGWASLLCSKFLKMEDQQPFINYNERIECMDVSFNSIDQNNARNTSKCFIYPNRIIDNTIVYLIDSSDTNLEQVDIYSITGQLIDSFRYFDNVDNIIVNFSKYTNGIYFIRCHLSDGTKETLKCIKL